MIDEVAKTNMDISAMLEVQVKEESETDSNVSEKDNSLLNSIPELEVAPVPEEEKNFYNLMFDNDLASVRFWRLHCTACDVHIGSAPSQAHNMYQHPILRTLLCAKCRAFYGDGNFEQGDDATDMFCRWCANGGSLYCCSYCSNTFCTKCIRRNFTSLVRKKIEADEKWKCFVCNPSDLYSARAVCWALLEHVKTVKRILKNSKVMSTQEIEDKMNLDESPCCPRTRKRKRRRNESNSEDEDETYVPSYNGLINQGNKRKQMRKFKLTQPMHTNLNGVNTSYVKQLYPIRPRPTSMLTNFPSNEQGTEPNKIRTVSDNVLFPSSSLVNDMSRSDVSSSSRFENTNTLQKQTIYHATLVGSIGSNAYITPSTADSAPRRCAVLIPQSQSQTSQPLQSNKFHAPQSLQSNTMVSIPKSPNRSSLVLRNLLEGTPSNIIELDSDSDDEPKIVENPTANVNNKNKDVIISSERIVPVALAWDKTNIGKIIEQSLKVMYSSLKTTPPSFSEKMSPHSQELKQVLSNINEKLVNFFNLNERNEDIDLIARKKMMQFYQIIRDTVLQLAQINDRAVREYNDWVRSRKIDKNASPSSTDENTITSSENVEIPLDMICVNDSDTESEIEKLIDHKVIEPSELVKQCKIVENVLFSKKQVVHRAVGDDIAHSLVDQEIQVYDVISRDYEKYIGHSVLKKVDYDKSRTDDSASKAVMTLENFGKYEEQFIFYLQHIEDHGIEIEDMDGLTDSNKIPIEKQIETNSSFILHADSDQTNNCEQEDSSTNYITTPTTKNDESITFTERLKEFEKTLKEVELRNKTKTDNDAALLILNNDVNPDQNDSNVVNVREVTSTERADDIIIDDCAIIDD
ncbi:uncharacterized protein LOC109856402 isoform X2 [Pseudomyrmex gracilis]|uniref:uncharacterized protein LOC109856402 isoform X2 n=1 Tax=Pseudomyrmex gracilis TaxID=219809 RepID=UPI000995174E|nr:uncharacterized protein LOC109856402 isoform X2 [Pseudomyrmex gracilis]